MLKHPAIKAAFKKLYGYTSDEQGIRHPLLDQDSPNVGVEIGAKVAKARGRPSKLTKRLQEKIAVFIEKGLSTEDAVKLSGIVKASFYKWLARGEEEQSGIYRRFYIRISDAQAGFKRTHLDRIVKASLEPTVKTRYNETYDGVDSKGKKINLRVTTTRETVPLTWLIPNGYCPTSSLRSLVGRCWSMRGR